MKRLCILAAVFVLINLIGVLKVREQNRKIAALNQKIEKLQQPIVELERAFRNHPDLPLSVSIADDLAKVLKDTQPTPPSPVLRTNE